MAGTDRRIDGVGFAAAAAGEELKGACEQGMWGKRGGGGGGGVGLLLVKRLEFLHFLPCVLRRLLMLRDLRCGIVGPFGLGI